MIRSEEPAGSRVFCVRVVNDAADSQNLIHDDEFARRYGFRGGLVPGVTVYAMLVRAALDAYGRGWLERGKLDARFRLPCYDGEEIEIHAERDGSAHAIRIDGPDGTERGTGSAGLRPGDSVVPPAGEYPARALPDRVPPVSRQALEPLREGLGSIDFTYDSNLATPFLRLISEPNAFFDEEGIAHPGILARFANRILARNVRLGPWLHVESNVTLFRSIPDGARISIRGRVSDLFERKGHELVELDLAWVVDGVVAMHARHVAIYRLRG